MENRLIQLVAARMRGGKDSCDYREEVQRDPWGDRQICILAGCETSKV